MEVRYGHLLYPSRSAHLVRREGSTRPLERYVLWRSCRVAAAKASRPHPSEVSARRRRPCRLGARHSLPGTGAAGRWHGAVDRHRRERQARWSCAWRAAPTAMASRSGGPTTSGHRRTHHSLWANRYSAATAAWGSPINIETSSAGIAGDFDLTVDASGNAVVAMARVDARRQSVCGVVMSARFDAGAGAWATPVLLNTDAMAADASPVMPTAPCSPCTSCSSMDAGLFAGASSTLSVAPGSRKLRSSKTPATDSFSGAPVALLDGSGNALAAWVRPTLTWLGVADEQLFLTQHRGLGPVASRSNRLAWCPAASASAPSVAFSWPPPPAATSCWHAAAVRAGARSSSRDPHRAFHEQHPDVECGADAGAGHPGRHPPVSAHRQRCRWQRARAVDRERRDAHGAQGDPPGPCRRRL